MLAKEVTSLFVKNEVEDDSFIVQVIVSWAVEKTRIVTSSKRLMSHPKTD